MNEDVRIVIADDHPLMRKGIIGVIHEIPHWRVVGEAADGEQALRLLDELHPHVLIIDIDMPKLNGLEVAKIVQQRKLLVKVIVLTMYDNETMFNRAIDVGVMGYVLKDAVVTETVDALRNVLAGKYYLSPSVSGALAKRVRLDEDEPAYALGLSKLTRTERKVLKLIAENRTSKEIAEELFISVRTVETHRSNICQKLDLHGTNALLRFALAHHDAL
jgi:DNA-binding NarL/FixJ family response regulator